LTGIKWSLRNDGREVILPEQDLRERIWGGRALDPEEVTLKLKELSQVAWAQ